MSARYLSQRFAQELTAWSGTDKLPSSANQDVRYGLELQTKRLKDRGLRMEYELLPPKNKDAKIHGITSFGMGKRKSSKYESRMEFINYMKNLKFFRDGRKVFSRKRGEILYTMTTWLVQGDVSGEETYCCPSCGGISTIRELQKGCPYCQARFLMSDLFPKITGFYFVEDTSQAGELNQTIKAWVLKGGVIGTVFCGLTSFVGGEFSLSYLLAGFVAGLLFGYMAWAFSMLGRLFKEAARSIRPLVRQQSGRKKLEALLGDFDPAFSYDYFVNQLVSVLKVIIYSDDRAGLAVCMDDRAHPEMDEIVEAVNYGAVGVNDYKIEGNDCTISVDLYMNTIHDRGRHLKAKRDVFRMSVVKNISRPEDPGFSIKKVQCRTCGGSFDATRRKHCPFCGNGYDLKEDSWIVTKVDMI